MVIWPIRKRAAYDHLFGILARVGVQLWAEKNLLIVVKNDPAVLAADHGTYTSSKIIDKEQNMLNMN